MHGSGRFLYFTLTTRFEVCRDFSSSLWKSKLALLVHPPKLEWATSFGHKKIDVASPLTLKEVSRKAKEKLSFLFILSTSLERGGVEGERRQGKSRNGLRHSASTQPTILQHSIGPPTYFVPTCSSQVSSLALLPALGFEHFTFGKLINRSNRHRIRKEY